MIDSLMTLVDSITSGLIGIGGVAIGLLVSEYLRRISERESKSENLVGVATLIDEAFSRFIRHIGLNSDKLRPLILQEDKPPANGIGEFRDLLDSALTVFPLPLLDLSSFGDIGPDGIKLRAVARFFSDNIAEANKLAKELGSEASRTTKSVSEFVCFAQLVIDPDTVVDWERKIFEEFTRSLVEIHKAKPNKEEQNAVTAKFGNDVRKQYQIAERTGEIYRTDIKRFKEYLRQIGWNGDETS
jgi:hypothetical protein